ncbi:helix-turn-helix domain-containing protein [Paenibacillus doosanensis]|uniref:helix-turn-helix domain-containing protein n=1 Tax=Paenibacillus doosanensis TaxID=1229154 RepID=UPI00217F718D|nr:helix-turn-helix domain-containing protein [Paenibacillus doosanensis]MCS7461976.1 helix-turn-helix domain-containing protein [Paenibacillus doosanensis]
MWRMNRGRTGSHRLFIRLLAPNLLFLLLPLLVGAVIYYKTLHEMEREVTAGNLHLLEQSRDILDRRFAELSSISMQLVGDTRIMQFQHVTEPYRGANINRILDTRKSLQSYALTNNFIFNYFIVYKNSELVFMENSTYGLFDFYQNFYYKDIDPESWKSLIIGSYHQREVLPAHQVTNNGISYSLLTYLHSLGYPGYPQGAIVITVDNREIRKLLGGLDLSGGGWAYILDEKGQMISSTSDDAPIPWIGRDKLQGKQGSMLENFGKGQMMVTYTTSAYNGWTYLVAQPDYVVLKKVLYIKKIIVAMALLFLGAGVLIAYLIAYRNSRPLRTIMETIVERMDGESYAGPDAYRFIRESVARLIDNNRELQDKMKKHAPFLQAALVERLLKGDYLPAKDTTVLLQHVGIETEGSRYRVAILQLCGYDNGFDRNALEELDVKRVKIKDILRREMRRAVYWHDMAEDRMALLFAFDSEEAADWNYWNEMLLRISEMIYSQVNIATRIAAGGTYGELLDVSRSCEEARQALEYLAWRNQTGVIGYHELPKESSGYYYPSDLEIRLTNLAKAGELDAVDMLLGELYQINFKQRHLPVPMLQLFMNEMLGTVVKLLPQVGLSEQKAMDNVKPLTGESASYEGLEKSYGAMAAVYRQVCDTVNEHKKSQNVKLLENIMAQLHQSFAHPDMSLDLIADRIGITRGYLSQFFKEQTGTNFSDYLEDLRMTLAKELLAKTDLPVYEIAVRSGYSSSNTFCRAFKRINGVNTSDYRHSKAN